MTAMTVRELNANISKAIALVEAGETLEILKNGKVVAEMRPRAREQNEVWRRAHKDTATFLRRGLNLGIGKVDPADKYDDAR